MSTSTVILWGINRPDHTSLTKSPTLGGAFWLLMHGHWGFDHEDGEELATKGAAEFTADLIRQGVRPEAAEHTVARVVITTTTDRQSDWLPDDKLTMAPGAVLQVETEPTVSDLLEEVLRVQRIGRTPWNQLSDDDREFYENHDLSKAFHDGPYEWVAGWLRRVIANSDSHPTAGDIFRGDR